MRFLRRSFLLYLCIIPGIILLDLSFGYPSEVSLAARKGWILTPTPERCGFIGEGQTMFLINIQANGVWQGWQLTKRTSTQQEQNIEFKGKSPTELRHFLLGSPCGISRLAGTMTLELKGRVQAGQAIKVVLPTNPSTGYLWVAEGEDSNLVLIGDHAQMYQITPRIGGIAAQLISFQALRNAETTLRLRYRRPWEADASDEIFYQIQGEQISLTDLAQNISLTIPDKALGSPELVPAIPISSTPTPDHITPAQELPNRFNWCDLGKCTPIRNQGMCGSCWAFATVGVFESKLLIEANNSQDLSEQYLVSCNTDGWGCDGGWWAHDYHIWKIPPSENVAGARAIASS